MNEHIHDPLVGLDSLIRCRTCGKILPYMEEELSKVTSAKRARRLLEEIASAGKYTVSSSEGAFAVYSRDKNGIREEITGKRISARNYRVYKRLIST